MTQKESSHLMADANSAKPRYRSPDGTYEVILKSVLEDASLTDAARSVLFFAVTKPEDWVLSVTALARDMGRPLERVRLALRELRKAGYVSVTEVRGPDGRMKRRTSRLNRHMVIHAGQNQEVNATSLKDSFQEVNNHPQVSYPPSDYGSSSDYGSVLLIKKNQEKAHDSAYADAPADRADFASGEENKAGNMIEASGLSSAQRESENPAAIGAAAGRRVCGCCGERRAAGWFELCGPAGAKVEALCPDCTGAYPSAVAVTPCRPPAVPAHPEVARILGEDDGNQAASCLPW